MVCQDKFIEIGGSCVVEDSQSTSGDLGVKSNAAGSSVAAAVSSIVAVSVIVIAVVIIFRKKSEDFSLKHKFFRALSISMNLFRDSFQ